MSSFRSRMPAYLPILVIAFSMMGLLGFQLLNERKQSSALLEDKEAETLKVHGELQKVKKKSDEVQIAYKKLNVEKTNLSLELVRVNKQLVKLDQSRSTLDREKKAIMSDLEAKKKELNDLKRRLSELENNEKEVKSLQKQLVKLDEKLRSTKLQHMEEVRKFNMECLNSSNELRKEIDRLHIEKAQIAENLEKSLQKQEKEKETLLFDPTSQNSERQNTVVDKERDKLKLKEERGAMNTSKSIPEAEIEHRNGKDSKVSSQKHVEDGKDDNIAVMEPRSGEGTEPGEGENDENIKIQDLDEDTPEKEEETEHRFNGDELQDEKIRLEDLNEDADGGATQ